MTNTQDLDVIVKMKFGSHLYGTDTPESDTDYKGIFIPKLYDCVLGRAPKSINDNTNPSNSKNTADDVDTEMYSLQHFLLELARKGETVALDMLHAPKEMFYYCTEHWDYIQRNRQLFYTKNLKAYLGYCRTQANKYGIKGSRLADYENAYLFIESKIDDTKDIRVKDIYEDLPDGENIKKYVQEGKNDKPDEDVYDVCGTKVMGNAKLPYASAILKKQFDNYGARAKLARENKDIDWKAISHAFRAGLQLKEIYATRDLKFPLADADYLRDIKQGKFHFIEDGIQDGLEKLVDEVEVLANASDFPEKVNVKQWEHFIGDCYQLLK